MKVGLRDNSKDAVMKKLLKNYSVKSAAVGLKQEIQAGFAIQIEAYKIYG